MKKKKTRKTRNKKKKKKAKRRCSTWFHRLDGEEERDESEEVLPLRSTMIFSGEGEREGRAIVDDEDGVVVVVVVVVVVEVVVEGVVWRRDWCHDV
ncbi:uncharacterized protein Triagg1_8584 [Trichoderma aggressivum f. europaeum]|uniref:Uncharacterized protein n=1 Tax=Trichoderma aggressivum f. europaeum TaxID=173218 RepID=A0AAE1IBQ4_9HYPO|nr:hypothetical protein Triagg1_8584 [Trichoderma aggressivum f. europaeum]